jgi:PadR family transcriptional regulator PadR
LTVTVEVNKKFRKELNAGTAALVLLSFLAQVKEPMYGYQIAKIIEARGENIRMMKQGALYPVLRSLAAAGLLSSYVDPSISGPPRRYYQITDSGNHTLTEWINIWEEIKAFIDNIVGGEENV